MKNPTKFLTLLLTEWRWAMRQPALCKAAVLARKSSGGDAFVSAVLRALVANGGDWRAAADWLDHNRPEFFGRVTKFKKWAASITAPRRRGLLLEWKGGAS